MELGDIAPDVVVFFIAKKIEFRAIGPLDFPVAANDVKSNRAVFKKILEFRSLRSHACLSPALWPFNTRND